MINYEISKDNSQKIRAISTINVRGFVSAGLQEFFLGVTDESIKINTAGYEKVRSSAYSMSIRGGGIFQHKQCATTV
jgi:hypothetical protein